MSIVPLRKSKRTGNKFSNSQRAPLQNIKDFDTQTYILQQTKLITKAVTTLLTGELNLAI